jgi:hypothetical protein
VRKRLSETWTKLVQLGIITPGPEEAMGLQPALPGPGWRPGGLPLDRWHQRTADQCGEPGPSGEPVAQLRAMLGGCHAEHAVDEASGEPLHHSSPHVIVERGGGADVPQQLHPAISRVDRLTPRPR